MSSSSNSLMDNLFQRSLEDLVKGFRLQLLGESSFISKALEEIRREIKATDLSTKSTALHKLSYLAALHGVDMSWAAFHAVEVVSSSRFQHKRIGYQAITQSFHDQTSVLLLITNQVRKDLNSANEYEVSLALECLARIGTHDLASDFTPEVFTLLGSSKAFVRKKAIGVVLRVFEKYPDAVKVCFKRLVENLESSDPQILSAVVGVFCELAAKDPQSCLPLAPELYKVLVDSRNNWVLIKVLKIFAKLASIEPRLGKKVVEPICEHMRRSVAKSLVFECVRTVVSSLSDHEAAVKLAVAKIREFLVEDDPNLKYLGLNALSIVAPKHLWAVLENKEAIVKALSDEDPNVKLEALHLLMAMVNEDNVSEISKILMNYALKSDPFFCNEIIFSVLSVCSRNIYEIIVDFDWYLCLLGEMARIPHCQRGEEIEHQLIDIGLRVRDARPQLVRVSWALLIDPALLGNLFLHPILSAAAWASGEYVEFSKNPYETVEALLQPRTGLLPPFIKAIYIHSAFKVLVFCLGSYFSASDPTSSSLAQESSSGSSPVNTFTYESIMKLMNVIKLGLEPLSETHDVEVQERAKNVLGFIGSIKQELSEKVNPQDNETESYRVTTAFMEDVFSEELGPVSATAQEKVCIPDGLVLTENLGDLEDICGQFLKPMELDLVSYTDKISFSVSKLRIRDQQEASSSSSPPPEPAAASLLAEHRKRHGMYYLTSQKSDPESNSTPSDYPPANDLASKISMDPFNPKRKPNQSKPRPVVVKLDEGDESRITSQAKTKPKTVNDDETLSQAIQSALLVKSKGKEKDKCERNSNIVLEEERLRTENQQNIEKKKKKKKNGERSSIKHRSRQRSSSEQIEIPDFLL
ncbi:AP-3 complex subunit delta [Cardamine amara subsp. amara]|uniref:AP-3 complex subunit delta n=1 Tax=Cardamine amara subsp. amara TaxID=228776 RepID=A0ABD1B530_CARAN